MTRAKWSAERERVFKEAMRWFTLWDISWRCKPSITGGYWVKGSTLEKLHRACAAAAKAKRGKR